MFDLKWSACIQWDALSDEWLRAWHMTHPASPQLAACSCTSKELHLQSCSCLGRLLVGKSVFFPINSSLTLVSASTCSISCSRQSVLGVCLLPSGLQRHPGLGERQRVRRCAQRCSRKLSVVTPDLKHKPGTFCYDFCCVLWAFPAPNKQSYARFSEFCHFCEHAYAN